MAREIAELEVDLTVPALDHWAALLHGPEVTPAGVRFVADFPRASSVEVTGLLQRLGDAGRAALAASRRLLGERGPASTKGLTNTGSSWTGRGCPIRTTRRW